MVRTDSVSWMVRVVMCMLVAVPGGGLGAAEPFRVTTPAELDGPQWRLKSEPVRREIEEIERAAPTVAPVKPAKPRKVLVYGRLENHDGPVQRCFRAMEAMGRKSGAFETVWTGDPAVFVPEHLQQFDAVVMNNLHDREPLLPRGFAALPEADQAAARERMVRYERTVLDYVAAGRGLVGIHAAVIGVGQWPEFVDLLGGIPVVAMVTGKPSLPGLPIRVVEPDHALCAGMGPGVDAWDEVFSFPAPDHPQQERFRRDSVRVLMQLEPGQIPEPYFKQIYHVTKQLLPYPKTIFPVTWVKPHGKGRVFYCSLGHHAPTYVDPVLMKHWLAGVQFAIGDLEAPFETPAARVRAEALAKAQQGDEAARLEAIGALGRVGTVEDVPLLGRLATKGDVAAVKQAAAKALETLPGDEIGPVIVSLVESAEPAGRATLIRCLSTRATQLLCGSRSIDALIGLLPKAAASERASLTQAIAASYRRYPDPRQRAKVLALLGSADRDMRTAVLPLVGELGGAEPLAAIRAARGDADAGVREAAVRGLCVWPDSTVAAELLEIAKETPKPEHRQLAVRAVARVAPLAANERPQEAVALLRQALALADEPVDRRIVLGQCAKVVTSESLAMAVAGTADETVRETAIRSVIELSRGLWPTHEADVRAALGKIKPLVTEPGLLQQIEKIMGTPSPPAKPKAA